MTGAVETIRLPDAATGRPSVLRRHGIWLATALLFAILPLVFRSGSALTVMSLMGIMIIFALSYNMLLGQTGMLSFGHAVYYGLGAFVAVQTGKVQRIVVWRLYRLGRLAGATIQLMDELEAKGVAFLSIRDGFDPSTPAGRLTRNVLASVAQFETEVRRERQMAGIEAARQTNGGVCPWGGREAGKPNKATLEKVDVAVLENGFGVNSLIAGGADGNGNVVEKVGAGFGHGCSVVHQRANYRGMLAACGGGDCGCVAVMGVSQGGIRG